MKKLMSTCVAAVAAALLASAALAEDLTIVYRTSGQGGDGTSTQYYSSGYMRTSDGKSDMLYDFSAGTMTTVDHEKKQYSELTIAELEAAKTAASAELEKMRPELESMPAAMRERMQKMMGGGGEVTLTRGGTREIAGYATQEYLITRGDSMKMQIWAASELELPVSLADIRRFTSIAGQMAAANPMLGDMSELVEKMKEVQGLPLADSNTFSMMGRTMQTSREANEVTRGALPASTFDLAAIAPGYRKVESSLARGGRR